MSNGDVEKELTNTKDNTIIEGQIELGSAKHWYMEPHAVLAVLGEDSELNLFATAQDIVFTQSNAVASTGIPRSKVSVKIRRLWGSFGGKPSLPFIASVCVDVNKLNKSQTLKEICFSCLLLSC